MTADGKKWRVLFGVALMILCGCLTEGPTKTETATVLQLAYVPPRADLASV